MLTLTAIEKQLLYHLSLNGRMSVTELGNRLSVSKQRVSYLMKKLSNNGVIIRFHSITNVYTLGKAHYRVFIKLGQIDFPKEKELRRYLMKHPDLAWVIYLDGDFDTDNAKFKATARYSFGWTDPKGIYGSPGA